MRILIALAAVAVFFSASPMAAAEEDRAAARALFERGIEQFQARSFEEALTTFQESHRLNPARSVLFNIAMCQRALNRYAESTETFLEYLELSGDRINAQRRALVQRQLDEMSAHIGTVRLQVAPAEAEVSIDGDAVARERWGEIRLGTGEHDVHAVAPGHVEVRERIDVAAGVVTEVSLELSPTTPPTPPVPPTAPVVEPPPTPVEPPVAPQPLGTETGEPEIVGTEGDGTETEDGDRGVHRRWWFWTIIGGVVVAGLGVGLGVGLSGGEAPEGDFNVRLP